MSVTVPDLTNPVAGQPLGAAHLGLHQTSNDAIEAIATELNAHEAAADGHPGYLTAAEGNAAYDAAGAATTVAAAAAAADSAHAAAGDPHAGYRLESATIGTADLTDAGVTLAKMANLAVDKVIGRATAGTGVPEAIALTAAGRALIDDADAPAQATTLGLGTTSAVVLGALSFSGVITPTQIVANTNDWNPTNIAISALVRISSNAARDLTGIAAPASGKQLRLYNAGSFSITLKRYSASSAAANRFDTAAGADVVLRVGGSVLLHYDLSGGLWLVLGA